MRGGASVCAMAFVVATEHLEKKFWAPVLSWAFIIKFVFFWSNIILAFLIAFGTQDLWKRESKSYEQPLIEFNNSALFYLFDKNREASIMYCTLPGARGLFREYNRVPDLSVGDGVRVAVALTPLQILRIDANGDGTTDEFHVKASFPVATTEAIVGVKLFLGNSLTISVRVRDVVPAL